MRRQLTQTRRLAVVVVAVVGVMAVAASSGGTGDTTPPPPVATSSPPPPPPPPPPPVASSTPAPTTPTPRPDGEACDARADCASAHCCFTVLGSVCARACTFEAVGLPGAEARCVVDADCARAERCVTRATVGATLVRVCEARPTR